MRFEVDDLVSGVNAGIGSTGTHDMYRMIGNAGEGRLEIALNRGQAFVLELKAVEKIMGIHKAQLLTYMKLSGISTGLLVNFNVKKLVDGIESVPLKRKSDFRFESGGCTDPSFVSARSP